jgi:hypothetical protein
MRFSNDVLTKGKSGKTELRALHSRGSFVMCKYLDPETLKPADKKTKLSLRNRDGGVEEYFIIPMRDPKRSLLIRAETQEKDRKVWNQDSHSEEDLWP